MDPPKVEHARQVLDLCRHGLTRLSRNPTGEDWLFDYQGSLALLRAAGHVLRNVDAQHPGIMSAHAAWWKKIKNSNPNPKIFWDFIVNDRNLSLKEGLVRAGQSATISIPGVEVKASTAGEHTMSSPLGTSRLPEPKYSYHMNSGPFVGDDPRELIRQALSWWDQQFAEIDKDALARAL